MQSIPPALPRLNAQRFRQELAGLLDTEQQPALISEEFKEAAAALCVLLARHYDPDAKDRLQLWEHVSKALALACSKIDDGDLDHFVTLCLESVRAEHSQVVANAESAALIGELTEREEGWRLAFVRYIQTHSYVVLVHGRRAWEGVKAAKAGAPKREPRKAVVA